MVDLYELDVYKLSEKLSDTIWFDFEKWDKKVKNSIGYQVLKSSDSIAANIAEGFGRYSYLDRRKFYLYARGSFEETKAWLRKLIRRKIIIEKDVALYKSIIDELGPKLNNFINQTKGE